MVELYSAKTADLKCGGPMPRAFTVRKAEEKDLPMLADYFGSETRVRDRFERGDVCVMTTIRDQVCAAVWFTAGPTDYHEDWDSMQYIFRITEGAGWSFDGKGTRLGAWGTLMGQLPAFHLEHGISDIYTAIEYDNQESISAHHSLGYHHVGNALSIRCFGLKLHLYRPKDGTWQTLPGKINGLQFRDTL